MEALSAADSFKNDRWGYRMNQPRGSILGDASLRVIGG
jgi:hypothetical protein